MFLAGCVSLYSGDPLTDSAANLYTWGHNANYSLTEEMEIVFINLLIFFYVQPRPLSLAAWISRWNPGCAVCFMCDLGQAPWSLSLTIHIWATSTSKELRSLLMMSGSTDPDTLIVA